MLKTIMTRLTLGLIFILIAPLSSAADDDSWGPAIGTQVPMFKLMDQDSNLQTTESLSGEQGLLIFFNRSADWCPFCKRQLIQLASWQDRFEKLGVNVISMTYDSADVLDKFTTEQGLNFTIISDPEGKYMYSLGIRDEGQKPGTGGFGIPHPGIMLIDTKREIKFKAREKGYKTRPPLEKVYEAVSKSVSMDDLMDSLADAE